MADKYVSLPLFSDAVYEYGIALQGESYILEFVYNERMKLYIFNLYNADRNPIVLGEALVPHFPIFLDYAIYPLTGYFYLYEKADILSEAYKVYPDRIDEYYGFSYVYSED